VYLQVAVVVEFVVASQSQ